MTLLLVTGEGMMTYEEAMLLAAVNAYNAAISEERVGSMTDSTDGARELVEKARATVWNAAEYLDPALGQRDSEAYKHIALLCSVTDALCNTLNTFVNSTEARAFRQKHDRERWLIDSEELADRIKHRMAEVARVYGPDLSGPVSARMRSYEDVLSILSERPDKEEAS